MGSTRRYIMSEDLQYWLAWCTYKCLPFLEKKEIKVCLEQAMANAFIERGFTILDLDIRPDHVFVDFLCGPNVQLSDMVKGLKGTTARLLLREFPQLAEVIGARRVWNPRYYVTSVGSPTKDEVQRYVDSERN